MKRITVYITENQYELIREEAQSRGVKMAEVLRSVLREWQEAISQKEKAK